MRPSCCGRCSALGPILAPVQDGCLFMTNAQFAGPGRLQQAQVSGMDRKWIAIGIRGGPGYRGGNA